MFTRIEERLTLRRLKSPKARTKQKFFGPEDGLLAASLTGSAFAYANVLTNPSVLESDFYSGWVGASGFCSLLLLVLKILLPEETRRCTSRLWGNRRLYFLTVFLVFSFSSHIFFGFWWSGIAGWTYEDLPLPGEPWDPSLEGRTALQGSLNPLHESALLQSFSPTMRPSAESRCWPQKVSLVETASLEEDEGAAAREQVRVITPESFGWVFPNYLSGDLRLSVDTLNMLWNPGRVNPIYGFIMEQTNWEAWRYPSHTPSMGGWKIFPGESVTSLWLYEITLCNEEGGRLRLVDATVKAKFDAQE